MLNYYPKNRFFIITLILIFFTATSYSQNTKPTKLKLAKELIEYTKSIYGTDDRLISGQTYQPKNIRAKGHPYFLTNDWLDATLFIKGVEFKAVMLKYNLEDNQLILKYEYEGGMPINLLLDNDFIDSIYFDQHTFINTSILPIQNPIGFLEKIHQGQLTSFLKHEISFKEEAVDINTFGVYLKPQKTLYIYHKDQLTKIKNRKAFLAYFSPQKKELLKFMRKNKISFKNANNNQLHTLLKYCNELLPTSKK